MKIEDPINKQQISFCGLKQVSDLPLDQPKPTRVDCATVKDDTVKTSSVDSRGKYSTKKDKSDLKTSQKEKKQQQFTSSLPFREFKPNHRHC